MLIEHPEHLQRFIRSHIKFYVAGMSPMTRGVVPDHAVGITMGVEDRPVHASKIDETTLAVEPRDATQLSAIVRIGGANVCSVHPAFANGATTILYVDSVVKALWMHTDFRGEQILDKTPLPAPGVTAFGCEQHEPFVVEARLYSSATGEPILVKPKPTDEHEASKFGYCPRMPQSSPKYIQVLADTSPELTNEGPKGSNHQTPRLMLRTGFVPGLVDGPNEIPMVRQVQWSKQGPKGTSFYLKIWHNP